MLLDMALVSLSVLSSLGGGLRVQQHLLFASHLKGSLKNSETAYEITDWAKNPPLVNQALVTNLEQHPPQSRDGFLKVPCLK